MGQGSVSSSLCGESHCVQLPTRPSSRSWHCQRARAYGTIGIEIMDGWIAVTAHGWYKNLFYRQQRVDGDASHDANFWQPSSRPPKKSMPIGTPFLFKLKKPHDAICGYGYFAGFSVLPDWLAWETFEDGNGVASFREMRERLGGMRARNKISAHSQIGCCLIAELRLLPPNRWVLPPADWKPNTVVGCTYRLLEGEGARIWEEVRAGSHTIRLRQASAAEDSFCHRGAPVLVEPRLGQGIFRVKVLDAYGRSCSLTGERTLPVIDAAHVRPFAEGGKHMVRNGLALRVDIHRLFDRGYVTFDQERRFVVSKSLKEEYDNGRMYYEMQGRTLRVPRGGDVPDDALLWHRERKFVG